MREIGTMNRDEALSLLRGGTEGIAEWNRRRRLAPGQEIPDLNGADLTDADLGENILDLDTRRAADLSGAKLQGADLSGAKLQGADLSRADLSGAFLSWADLLRADLREADLTDADFELADLTGADLTDADLSRAHFNEADLGEADLSRAVLHGAHLADADLYWAVLVGADLTGADLSRARMVRVDLRGAKLRDCRILGISAWDIETDEHTEQANLIISAHGDPVMTVDNLKVAQFIYLLLNNREIRQVIDTITSKVVLILGRFTPERKALLDAIREALRQRNYLPVMFDFEKPDARGYTETVTTLARMARFIIVDLTDATEVRNELGQIVRDLPSVPVQPLILASQTEYVTFEDLQPYPWLLKTYRYKSLTQVINSLSKRVLAPAEAKVEKLKKAKERAEAKVKKLKKTKEMRG
jgi:uncharacterized protein YjbI with pentapeptide repeats